MTGKYNGVIFYKDCTGNKSDCKVLVNKYIWSQNCLVLFFDGIVEIIPYHAFNKASFERMEDNHNACNK